MVASADIKSLVGQDVTATLAEGAELPARVQKPSRMRDVAQMEVVSEGQADARHLRKE